MSFEIFVLDFLDIYVAQALRGNTVLSVLKLRDCKMYVEGTKQIVEVLLDNTTSLTVLDLSFNSFDSAGMKYLGTVCLLPADYVHRSWSYLPISAKVAVV